MLNFAPSIRPNIAAVVDRSNADQQTSPGSSKDIVTTNKVHFRSRAIIIIAASSGGYAHLPGFLNGCMIFGALSCANTSLYIASRALYGMTRVINPWKWFGWFRLLGTVWHRNGVPMWALVASVLSFGWLPFLQLKGGYAVADVRALFSQLAHC